MKIVEEEIQPSIDNVDTTKGRTLEQLQELFLENSISMFSHIY